MINLVYFEKDKLKPLEPNLKVRVLQFASLVFDASVWEIFSSLLYGAELYILPGDIRNDPHMLTGYMARCKISIALLPPALLGSMATEQLQDLRVLLVGGDLTSLEIMTKWSQGRLLINAYGPTEITVCATMHHYVVKDLNTNIGKPIRNTRLYVLDNDLSPVPIGVIGELYIGGAGLARGYLNQESLTVARFINNPFATETDNANGYTRLYKTGDMVRWLADGKPGVYRQDG